MSDERSMTPDELEAEAMKLDLASRIELVRRLTASVPTPPVPTETSPPPPEAPKPLTDDERERLWLQEAMARSRELKKRQLQTEPPESQGVFRRPLPARPSRPPLPAGEGRGEGRRSAKRPSRPSRKKPPARIRKPRSKPARAQVKRAKTRPRPAKARTKPRSKPRRSRR